MNVETKSMMNIEVCCDGATVLQNMGDAKQQTVGYLYGNASDYIQRANPAGGAPFKGVGGTFKIVPTITDETKGGAKDAYTSGNLFLPAPMFSVVKEKLDKVLFPYTDKPEKKARGAVEFVARIILAKSADGQPMWGTEWLKEPVSIDALAPLEKDFPAEMATASAKTEAAPATGGKGKK